MKILAKITNLIDIDVIYGDKGGIFYYLQLTDADDNPLYPLLTSFIDSNNYLSLDVDYEIGTSAEKYFSPLMMKLIQKACTNLSIDYEKFLCDELTATEKENIIEYVFDTLKVCSSIYIRFSTKWKKIWDALNTQYNPLDNYSMHQVRTPNLTKTNNGKGTAKSTSKSGVYGFNSPSANDSGLVDGEQTDEIINRTETETGTDTLDRDGNIGVTSSQQMLEQEWQVRQHDFYKMIYNDIDSILCLLCY